jgi:hypothetical protein
LNNLAASNTISSLSKTGLPYPFKFLCKNKLNGNKLFDHVYTFKTKYSLKYQVNIVQYNVGVFGVKFHLKMHGNSPSKFKLLSNKGDSIVVLKTIVSIMKQILDENKTASFAFIGMPLPEEGINKTKRYTVYKLYCRRYFSYETFDHVYDHERSFYMLLNKANKNIPHEEIEKIAEQELREDLISEVNFARSTC